MSTDALFDVADMRPTDEPSRDAGTCATCGQTVNLRPPHGDAPYPALATAHTTRGRNLYTSAEMAVRCAGSHQVPAEWRAWLTAENARWADYVRRLRAWRPDVVITHNGEAS